MKRQLLCAAFFMIFAAAAQAAPVQRIHAIQRPLFSVPAIAQAGESFSIKLKVPAGAALKEAYLDGIEDSAVHIALALQPAASENGLSVFSAKVPKDTPESLYDLGVLFSNDTQDSQPHSVKVIKEFKKDFDFIHLTDIHFNLTDLPGKDLNRIRRRIIQDIAKYNVEFVLFGGDLSENPETYDWDFVYSYEEFLRWLRAPIFMVPGNHELYSDMVNGVETNGSDYWKATYGPTYFSFDYGSIHFLGINTYDWPPRNIDEAKSTNTDNAYIGREQWEWLKKDLAESSARGESCVAFTHIPIESMPGGKAADGDGIETPNTKQFTSLLSKSGCTHIFAGHLHFESVNKFGKLTEVLTRASGTAVGHKDSGWVFRIAHVRGGRVAGWENHEIKFADIDGPAKK
ncbi:MAG: metallophosphoesterase [bacterium]